MMNTSLRPAPELLATMALLDRALASLDNIGESIAAAHLSLVIEILAAHVDAPSVLQH